MKLVLILTLVAVISANPSSLNRGFYSLVSSLTDDYMDDMEEILGSEQVYLDALEREEEVSYSEVELLIGEEEELEDEPINEDGEEEESDSGDPDISTLPEELDNRARGIVHRAIYQGMCGSCGWVSGTQTLEARMAFISENWIPYSIQNFMNCAGRPCVGAQPYTVNTQVRKSGVAVPEYEIPYTKRACVKEDEGKKACYAKCGAKNPADFTNALHDQFVFIAGTREARSEAKLIAALQEGPVTTCFSKKSKQEGERCSPGCSHANSIVGYDKEKFIIQESYGKNWGGMNDGSWRTTKGSICAVAITKKAYYPKIMYDYDRANAYFTAVEGGVKKEELKFVDREKYGIVPNNTRNWGTAKNKCAFLGSACKGVVQLSPEVVELVSDFGAGSSGDLPAFKKVQMVVYLRHEGTGKYVGIKKNKKGLHLIAVQKGNAAPFFTSYARFISFQYPRYHLVDNDLERIVGGIKDIDVTKGWTLNGCNIYNDVSGNSFDQVPNEKGEITLGSSKYDATSSTQKFNVGLSGKWLLKSTDLNLALASRKKGGVATFTDHPKASVKRFRWNARQIITERGNPFTTDMTLAGRDFKFEDKEYAMTPRDCTVSKLIPIGFEDHLALEDGKLVMSSDTDSRWTFEYGDL